MMNRTATAKRRNVSVTMAYSVVVGYGKVKYEITCASAVRHFTPPTPETIRSFAEAWGLEQYSEIKRHIKRIGTGQILTIECSILAGTTRDQRTQFATALLNKI